MVRYRCVRDSVVTMSSLSIAMHVMITKASEDRDFDLLTHVSTGPIIVPYT